MFVYLSLMFLSSMMVGIGAKHQEPLLLMVGVAFAGFVSFQYGRFTIIQHLKRKQHES